MRTKFFELLIKRMKEDQSVFLIVADMGLGLVEAIQKAFPERFINVGIAEQNMIGIAAGLSNVGFRPFCYTISNFLVQRCFEQIRNDVCLHQHPITLVGNSAGFDNGPLGPTHQSIDDIGCIKDLPSLNIYSPSSLNSIDLVFEDIMKNSQPAYVRMGKSSFDIEPFERKINQMVILNEKSDNLVIAHGVVLENCVKALSFNNDFSVYCLNKVKPLDKKELQELFQKYSKIIVVEDHFATSGLYNSLCQFLVENQPKGKKVDLYSLAVPEVYEKIAGDRDYFANKYGYSPEKIAQFISELG